MQIFQTLTYFITKYQNIACGNITASLTRKSFFKFWEAVKLMMADTDFLKSNFFLKAWTLSWGNTCCQLFLWSDTLTSLIFKKKSANSPGLNYHILSASCSVTTVLLQPAIQTTAETFFLKQPIYFGLQPRAVCARLILLHRILQIHVLKG